MNLEQYLDAIKNCPNEEVDVEGKLTQRLDCEYGIYDNYYIPFNIDDMMILAEALQDSGRFKIAYLSRKNSRGSETMYLEYVPGIIVVQISSMVGDYFPEAMDGIRYNHYITLHPYNKKGLNPDQYTKWKAMANAIIDLVEVMKDKRIPFCLSSSWHGSKVKSDQEMPNFVPIDSTS